MYKVNVTLKGLAPIRFNKFNDTQSAAAMSEKEYKADAETRAYRNKKGLYIPAHAIEECLCGGAKKVKLGVGNLNRRLKAVVFVVPKEVPLSGKEATELYTAVVRIPPKVGGRVRKYWVWAEIPWSVEFELTIIDDRIPPEKVHQCFIEAGLYEGLLDGRPRWGRFEVEKFELIKE